MKIEKYELLGPWVVTALVLASLAVFLFIGLHFGHFLGDSLPEERRVVIRSIFYGLTIITFPLTNLIRHIQLRLNQTMPGNKPAKTRYLVTVIVSMAMVESIGILGFVMFMLGDEYNTLYIFLGLSALGAFLYKPKYEEYNQIADSLSANEETTPG